MNIVPHAVVDLAVYLDGTEMLGVVDATLPEIAFMSAELEGAGVAGKIDVPVQGMLESMTLSLNWRQVTANVAKLAAPKGHTVDLRGALQGVDGADSSTKIVKFACMTTMSPKKSAMGSLKSGDMMGNDTEFEVFTMQITIDGTKVVDIDKLNYRCEIDGTDYLADVKAALGK